MTSYPETLPRPLRDDYEFSPTNRITRTEMESGRARQRIEFDSVPTFVSVTFLFDANQASLFDAWADQIAGAEWWDFPIYSPMGYETEQVRFTQSPAGPKLVGIDRWVYTAQLEVRFKPQIDNGWLAILPEYLVLGDIFDRAAAAWPEWDFQTYMDTFDRGTAQWPEPLELQ